MGYEKHFAHRSNQFYQLTTCRMLIKYILKFTFEKNTYEEDSGGWN